MFSNSRWCFCMEHWSMMCLFEFETATLGNLLRYASLAYLVLSWSANETSLASWWHSSESVPAGRHKGVSGSVLGRHPQPFHVTDLSNAVYYVHGGANKNDVNPKNKVHKYITCTSCSPFLIQSLCTFLCFRWYSKKTIFTNVCLTLDFNFK